LRLCALQREQQNFQLVAKLVGHRHGGGQLLDRSGAG